MEISSVDVGALAQFFPLVILSIFAFWKENAVLFLATGSIAMMSGLYSPDILSGTSSTTALGITIGLCLITYAFLCFGWTFRLIFWRGKNAQT